MPKAKPLPSRILPGKTWKGISLILGVLTMSFLVGYFVLAWTEPAATPPGGNVSAPLNVGNTGQSKTGGLILNTGGAATGLIVRYGNVGIGTTGPDAKLTVNDGNVYIYGNDRQIWFPTNDVREFIRFGSWDRYAIGVQSSTQYFRTGKNFAWYKGGTHNDAELNPGGGTVQMVIKDGNVGIGTTSPGAKLDVRGNVQIPAADTTLSFGSDVRQMINLYSTSYGIGVQGYTQYYRSSGNFAWYIGGSHNDAEFNTGGGIAAMVIKRPGGNVGIGTTAPTQKLDVVGYVKGQTGLCIGNDCRTSWPSGTGGLPSGTSGQTLRHDGTNWIANSVIFNNGTNVGIGTTGPAQKLHVAGHLRVDGATVAPEGTLRDDGGGWVRTYGNTGWYSQTHGGGWYMADSTWIRSYGSKSIYHNAGIMRTDGTFQVGSDGGTLNVVNGGNFAYRTNVLFANTAGNVGIGTTAPAYKLDIAGALRLRSSSAPTGANGVMYYDSGTNKFRCYQAGAWVDCVGTGGAGYWAVSGNNIYNTNTGNVGIGTSSPNFKAVVAGGDAYISQQGKGLILRDVDGPNCHRITVNSAGILLIKAVSCTDGSAIVGPPSAPRDLRTTAGSGIVSLTWIIPSDDGGSAISKYKIYRSTLPGRETSYGSSSVTSYNDSGVSGGTTYYYQVSAVNASGEGPRSNEASATPTGAATQKIVFLSGSYTGNLGGLAGADSKCQSEAAGAGLTGAFKAWLSDGSTSANSRLTHATVPYKLVNGTTIANNWADLIDGTLQNPIIVTASGNTFSDQYVWANTTSAGEIGSTDPNSHCSNWGSTFNYGWCGYNSYTSSFWTSFSLGSRECYSLWRLYCFEQ